MKKTICISIALLLAAVVTVSAQENNRRENRRSALSEDINKERMINVRENIKHAEMLAGLNKEQREQVEQLQAEVQEGLTQLNNKLNEKQEQLQALETQKPANINAINQNIDEQAKLMADKMKLKAGLKQKIRALLNKEQLARYDINPMQNPNR